MKRKDRGLCPCINYRGPNKVTVKFWYLLPLVPTTLEQLRTTKYCTKLDLSSTYNRIHIREGSEEKMAFSTALGHYEYLVMLFGLVNSPSVFQTFISNLSCDMQNRWVRVYIDDNLICSNALKEHVRHVRAVLQRVISPDVCGISGLYHQSRKCCYGWFKQS